jgi:hypothetical protein
MISIARRGTLSLVILALVSVFGTLTSSAQSKFFVRSGASGGNNGSDWNNAFASLPATLVRGATYYVADGTYPGYTFDDAANGTSWIFIKKATAATNSGDVGWSADYGDGVALFNGSLNFRSPYVDIDGVVGGGPTSWTTGHGIKIRGGGGGSEVISLMSSDADHLRFRHLEIEHADGNRTPSGGASIFKATWDSVRGQAISVLGGADDVLIEYCYAWNCMLQIIWTIDARNWVVQYSYLGPNGIGYGSGTSQDLHRASYAGYSDRNMTFRWNYWKAISNTAIVAFVNGGTNSDIYFYGNIVDQTGQPDGNQSWVDASHSSSSQTNFKFHNNTLYGWTGGNARIYLGPGSGNEAYNNVFSENRTASIYFSGANNYHTYYNCLNGDSGQNQDATLAANQSQGQDLNVQPFISPSTGDFRPSSQGATAMAAGLTLGAPFNVDMFGNVRGADGKWDRGAVEFTGSTGPIAPIITSGPSNATVSVGQPASFTVSASGSQPMTFQWQRNGANIAGATGTSYTLTSAATTDSGATFRVIVTNAAGSLTSGAATLTVSSTPQNVSPTVSLTQPTGGTTVTAPANITFAASASDSDGSVVRVEFYNGATKLGEATSSPFTWAWANVPAGSYTLTARAIDNQGATTTSSSVALTVNSAPPADALAVGDRVMVNIDPSLRVRSSPQLSSTVVGNAPYHELGTVVAGPVVADGFTFYQVNFDAASDGWSIRGDAAAPWLVRTTTAAPKAPSGLRIISN